MPGNAESFEERGDGTGDVGIDGGEMEAVMNVTEAGIAHGLDEVGIGKETGPMIAPVLCGGETVEEKQSDVLVELDRDEVDPAVEKEGTTSNRVNADAVDVDSIAIGLLWFRGE